MDTCTLLYLVFGLVLFSEVIILLNIHRVVKVSDRERTTEGGEVKRGLNRLQLIRMAILSSIMMMVVIFGFVLNEQGCLVL